MQTTPDVCFPDQPWMRRALTCWCLTPEERLIVKLHQEFYEKVRISASTIVFWGPTTKVVNRGYYCDENAPPRSFVK